MRSPLKGLSPVVVWLMFLLACARHEKALDDATLRVAGEDAGNWLMYGRTYDDHRFSSLNQINEQTVSRLGLAWSREMGTTRGLEATPLVKDGVLYTTAAWSVTHAIDARTGAILWTYDPKVSRERAFFYCCDVVNRGAALYRGRVYVGTLDGRLIALNERTGAPLWTADTTENGKPHSITSAPRIARGMVVVGNGGSEFGVRGYVSAYDAETGKMAWRSYTVPGTHPAASSLRLWKRRRKPGRASTGRLEAAARSGRASCTTQRSTCCTSGLATRPPGIADSGDGDNLYTASILALRATTGEIAWHFQTTPGDNWDYDAAQPLVQADLRINGVTRQVIMQANKNGFFYILDRKTGEFISGAPFVSGITWATGLDPKGRPIEAPGAAGMKPVIISPSTDGAHNWNPMAFSPTTRLVYLAAKSGTQSLHVPDSRWKYDANNVNVGYDVMYDGPLNAKLATLPPTAGRLLAWDPAAQREAWSVLYPTAEGGGVLVTGNLVFQGRADGVIAAYRATDGKELWRFDAETGIMAPPVTFQIDGTQYISVMAGWGGAAGLLNAPGNGPIKPGFGRIVTFKLDGAAKLRAPVYGHKGLPNRSISVTASKRALHEGELLYGFNCAACHGVNVVSGPLPDLRYSSKEVLEKLETVVLCGSRGIPACRHLEKS